MERLDVVGTGAVEQGEKILAKKNLLQKLGMEHVIGRDSYFQEVLRRIPVVAKSHLTLLITGETGAGKEVLARAIHAVSRRSHRPFVPVDCGAIPPSLLENELFGHRKGSYTDASNHQEGVIAEAEGGTLFLDEIDSLAVEAQGKLLRLLQDKTYRPLGHVRLVKADIRIIVASNVDIRRKVSEGQFRQDLFYRFTFHLHLPPLRERKGDILALAEYFLCKYGREYGQPAKILSPAAVEELMRYEWPGNIRELESVILKAILQTPREVIPPEEIDITPVQTSEASDRQSFTEAKKRTIEVFEREYVARMLSLCGGSITRAAREARKDRADFSRLLKKHRIDPRAFKSACR